MLCVAAARIVHHRKLEVTAVARRLDRSSPLLWLR